MAYRTPAPLRTVRALVRALLGLVLLTALLVGTPYALLLFGTQPTELSFGIDVLLRPDDGTLFFTVLTCIGWAAWAAFTWTVLLEIVAVARRRSAPRARPGQPAVPGLVPRRGHRAPRPDRRLRSEFLARRRFDRHPRHQRQRCDTDSQHLSDRIHRSRQHAVADAHRDLVH
ncbi:hypothetical protein ACFQ0G_53410 [Streptomyces chiangmaiensis]